MTKEEIEAQVVEILAQADPEWLSTPPQVREENVPPDWETYQHQLYAAKSREWQAAYEQQHRVLFPPEKPEWPPSKVQAGQRVSDLLDQAFEEWQNG